MPINIVPYPGGKTLRIPDILPYILPDTRLVSPFIGGGSIEYACLNRGQVVYAGDLYEGVANLHIQFSKAPKALLDLLCSYRPLTEERYWKLVETYKATTDLMEKAACYMAIAKATPFGKVWVPSYTYWRTDPRRQKLQENILVEATIDYFLSLPTYNLTVRHQDWLQTIGDSKREDILYLDPPYPKLGQAFYPTGEVEPRIVLNVLKELYNPWVLSYTETPDIVRLFQDYQQVVLPNRLSRYAKYAGNRELLILGNHPGKE